MSTTAALSPAVAEIIRFNRDRKPRGVRLKYERMDKDPFAFFRGTDHLFALAWLELKPPDPGPEILVSGDLHLENFGAYRIEGEDYFDINDFDEALVAACSLDLVRCVTSILLALELWKLKSLQTTGTALAFLDEYRKAVKLGVESGVLGEIGVGDGHGPVGHLLGATAPGSHQDLLNRRTRITKSGQRQIKRDAAKRPEASEKWAGLVRQAVEEFGSVTGRAGEFRVLDLTGRIAGIGSLGLKRYLVLVEGSGSPDGNRLLDLKEARASSQLGCATGPQPDWGGSEARRTILSQRTLQAHPPRLLEALKVGGLPFRLRKMVPDENRADLGRLAEKPARLRQAVEAAGRVVAWSQLRASRAFGPDRSAHLRDWALGSALDSLFAVAARFAERTRREYEEFHDAYSAGYLNG
jgi:uncharacterized protein (DUF2252 family)